MLETPALALAPMDGITDAPMREFLGAWGAFSYAVSEFIRVSIHPLPAKVFAREIPELLQGGRTQTGLPVQVQILGGDPENMAQSAVAAVRAGATSIDINFGCPAPTVNRNDGGASLLRFPCRIREVVATVRGAVPLEIPVSAKLRLGWEDIDDIDENAAMAIEAGASWLTLHARTRVQGYQPPVYWPKVGEIRARAGVPVVANGDIWTLDDFRRCQDETGCRHFMIGRGSLANPGLSHEIARELGLSPTNRPPGSWREAFEGFLAIASRYEGYSKVRSLHRLKQWASLGHRFGDFPDFERLKRAENVELALACLEGQNHVRVGGI